MNKKCLLALISLIFFSSGCMKPSEAMIKQAILETELAEVIATATEKAKYTPTPTSTLTPTLTITPSPTITLTPTISPEPKKSTAIAVQTTKDYLNSFSKLEWRELNNYPNNHKGEKIRITGRIFQIIDAIDMLLWYPGTYDAFYVSFLKEFTGIYEDDSITIFGYIEGSYCYSTMSGGSNCVPKIIGIWFEE